MSKINSDLFLRSVEHICALGRWLADPRSDAAKAAELVEIIGHELHARNQGDVVRLVHGHLALTWPNDWAGRERRVLTLLKGESQNVPTAETRHLAMAAILLAEKRRNRELHEKFIEAERMETWARQKREALT